MLKKYSSHVQKKVDFKTRNFFLKKIKLPLSCMVEKDDENSSTAKHTLVSHYYISAVVFRFRHRSRRAGTGWGKVGKGCNEREGGRNDRLSRHCGSKGNFRVWLLPNSAEMAVAGCLVKALFHRFG